MKIIDPHLHLFALAQGDYHWLKPENPPFWPDKHLIAQTFTEQSLELQPPFELAGYVHIEAGFNNLQPWREIAWLEQHCQLNFRAIAMLDISLPTQQFQQQLQQLTQFRSVVGVRYILDDAPHLLSQRHCLLNFRELAQQQLSFELQMSLIDEQAVSQLITLLENLPQLKLCINHAGWPPLDKKTYQLWKNNIERLSQFPQLYIKCSGFEMSKRALSPKYTQQVIVHVLTHFGENRTMLASNFPLSTWQASYQQTWLNYLKILKTIPSASASNLINKLCSRNAQAYYQFTV